MKMQNIFFFELNKEENVNQTNILVEKMHLEMELIGFQLSLLCVIFLGQDKTNVIQISAYR